MMKGIKNIKIISYYTEFGNDYEGTEVYVNEEKVSEACSERDAVKYAFGEDKVDKILEKVPITRGTLIID